MKRETFVIKKDPNDYLKDIVLCRNCGKEVVYGSQINNTGHMACPECYETMRNHINYVRDNNYEEYRNSDHLYLLGDCDYQKVINIELLKKNKKTKSSRVRKIMPILAWTSLHAMITIEGIKALMYAPIQFDITKITLFGALIIMYLILTFNYIIIIKQILQKKEER